MDCVIPGHNVKAFSCAVGCLSRIGKEMYIEFDPLQGLILRALNDAKSSFCSFSFDPKFFERCSVPLDDLTFKHADTGKRNLKKRRRSSPKNMNINESFQNLQEDKYICRVPLRTVHSILRPRKSLVSLRIRSYQSANEDSLSQLSSPSNFMSPSPSTQDSNHSSQNSKQIGSQLKPRVNVKHQLSFEFLLSTNGILRITRRIHVADATSLTAVAPRTNCSEIISHPKTLLKMLSPLKKTAEVALHIHDRRKLVSASSFHPSDTSALAEGDNATNAALLISPNQAANVHLKTETSMCCDEFDDYQFRDDRALQRDDIDDNLFQNIPSNVNEEVVLVFGIKEVKAMLQFCSQVNVREDFEVANVSFFFEWGGKPIILETARENYSAELVMATLDHELLVGFLRDGGGGYHNSKANTSSCNAKEEKNVGSN